MTLANGTRFFRATEGAELLSKSTTDVAKAERIVLSLVFAKTLRKTQNEAWRREWESWKQFSETPMNPAAFSTTLGTSTV
jgi:hypothetical protein